MNRKTDVLVNVGSEENDKV